MWRSMHKPQSCNRQNLINKRFVSEASSAHFGPRQTRTSQTNTVQGNKSSANPAVARFPVRSTASLETQTHPRAIGVNDAPAARRSRSSDERLLISSQRLIQHPVSCNVSAHLHILATLLALIINLIIITELVTNLNPGLAVGGRVRLLPESDARRGTVSYTGLVPEIPGIGAWVGVTLDEPTGKNDGSVKGKRYFECGSNCGVFVRPERCEAGDFPVLDEFDEDLEEL